MLSTAIPGGGQNKNHGKPTSASTGGLKTDQTTTTATAKQTRLSTQSRSATSSTSSSSNPNYAYSLDGTIQVADELVRKKRLERAASMKANPHHLGLGGATIRAVWEQENVPELEENYEVPMFLKTPRTVSVVGAPMSWGQPLAGTDHGPALVHRAGLIPAIKRAGWRVNEDRPLTALAPTPTQAMESEKYAKETGALAHNSSAIGAFLNTLSNETEAIARRNEFVLTVGGDHSIACGSLAGILRARPDTGVIWVDAHADLHTPLTSETGNMHGMPVGILMADDALRTRIPGFGWLKNGPRLNPKKIVYVGARDLDMAERREIKAKGILCFTMSDVDRWGIGQIMERTFKHLGNCPIHLSYDVDAVDAEYAPHTGTVVRGGFTFREANFIAESVAETNRLCSMDLVEINPTLGDGNSEIENETVQLGLTIVSSAMGQRIL
jgi:arginase